MDTFSLEAHTHSLSLLSQHTHTLPLSFVNFGQAMTYSVPFTLAVFMVRREKPCRVLEQCVEQDVSASNHPSL